MTAEEIKRAVQRFDLALRPCILFINPEDAEEMKETLPEIEKKVLVQVTPWMEKGEICLMERKDLEI